MARVAALLAGILLASSPAPALARPPASSVAVAVEPDAAAAVRRSAAYLRLLGAFALDAEMTIDAYDEDGDPVREAHRLHYEYRAPSGLFVDWRSNGETRQIFCNGRAVSFFLPASRAYVTLPEDGNAGETLVEAAEEFGIVLPLPDIYLWAISGEGADAIQYARLVGLERIRGVATDHYVLRQEDVDWEIWIDRGPRPLPRKILITARDDPDQPQFSASLRWNVAPRIAAGRFTFVPPAGARRIEDDDPLARDIALLEARGRGSAASG